MVVEARPDIFEDSDEEGEPEDLKEADFVTLFEEAKTALSHLIEGHSPVKTAKIALCPPAPKKPRQVAKKSSIYMPRPCLNFE